MSHKNFKNYIIISLIIQITFELCVSGKPIDTMRTITISDDQLQYLIDDLCELELITNMKLENCQKSFFKSQFLPNPGSSLPELPSPGKINCNSDGSIKFQVVPSLNWQLVVLVPEHGNVPEFDKYAINYSLVDPKLEYGEVAIPFGNRSTFWSTELRFDKPLQWRGGFLVCQENDLVAPETKVYDIKMEFFEEKAEDLSFLTALFMWNTTGEGDETFDVVNSCDGTGITDDKVWPGSKPHMFFTHLRFNSQCDVRVSGVYGTSKLQYRTPELCQNSSNCSVSDRLPEIPQNVSIEATEKTANMWDIHVKWSTPRYPIELYNITLHSRNTSSLQVAGDKTEVVFEGVSGTGLYEVELNAKLGRKIAVTSRRAIFPVPGDIGAAAPGATLGAAACAAAALTVVLALRRVKSPSLPDATEEGEVQSKKGDIEGISITIETEDVWEIRSEKLLLHEVIGEGAFGVVRRGTLTPNGTTVAVKMLKDFPSVEEIRSFKSETELMKSVGVHPHLVSLVGVCSGRRPLIVTEYCSRGDLLTYLRCTWDIIISKRKQNYYNNNIEISNYRNDLFKCKTAIKNPNFVVNKLYDIQEICDRELTPLDLLSFCRQIAMGMEFLAANRVVHRDLAARNILVTADRTLKIADFGLSRDVYEENQYKQKGNGKMPVKWMALESLTRRIYTTQSDVWSFGVVVWEVATVGAAPYANVAAARLPRLLRSGYRMPRPSNCSPELYELMVSCWREAPRERPTFAELHARLDELLQAASAHTYLQLELELEPEVPQAAPTHFQYLKMLVRGKWTWSINENYERPLKPSQSNHYSSPPQVHTKVPFV